MQFPQDVIATTSLIFYSPAKVHNDWCGFTYDFSKLTVKQYHTPASLMSSEHLETPDNPLAWIDDGFKPYRCQILKTAIIFKNRKKAVRLRLKKKRAK